MNTLASVDDAGQHIEKSNNALNEHHWSKDNQGGKYPSLQSLSYEVHRLFSFDFQSWGAFASTKYWEKDKPEDKEGGTIKKSEVGDILSLEFLHNNIHASLLSV
jgi:tyrosinase